jgi:HipA-like protein
MNTLNIYRNGMLAGTLTALHRQLYVFRYDDKYYRDSGMPPISLTLPKTQQTYSSPFLFPFFFNMLSEGVNRKLQCTQWQIDEADHFSLLAATAQYDTIGAIAVKPVPSS